MPNKTYKYDVRGSKRDMVYEHGKEDHISAYRASSSVYGTYPWPKKKGVLLAGCFARFASVTDRKAQTFELHK